MFDTTGAVVLVTENTLTDLVTTTRDTGNAGLAASVLASLRDSFRPDALIASTVALNEGPCTTEAGVLAVAVAAEVLAGAALTAAIVACAATGATCAAIPALTITFAAAAAAVVLASQDLAECVEEANSGGGGGGGGGGGSPACYYVIWEISYDGGETWQLLDAYWVCENEV